MKVENSISVTDAEISKGASILNGILGLGGVKGIKIRVEDAFIFDYDSKYFTHYIIEDNQALIVPKSDNEYMEMVESLSKIDFMLRGKSVMVPANRLLTQEATIFDTILCRIGKMPINVDEDGEVMWYNDAYYELVDGVIDLKDKFKRYIKEENEDRKQRLSTRHRYIRQSNHVACTVRTR